VGTPEGTVWATVTAVVAAALAYMGARKNRLARLVERTPTTSAASAHGGDLVEIKGRVVAAERTLETLRAGRDAVWTDLQIEEYSETPGNDPSWDTILHRTRAVEFHVDDGTGRVASVVLMARENAVTTLGDVAHPVFAGKFLERIRKILQDSGKTAFDPEQLRWTERALCVGDPVYVLGPAEVTTGPPVVQGYRSIPSSQLVMRDTRESPLTVAAMTEEAFVAKLKGSAWGYFGCAAAVAVLGLIVSALAFATTLMDCAQGSD
jgi:hypothetical protein